MSNLPTEKDSEIAFNDLYEKLNLILDNGLEKYGVEPTVLTLLTFSLNHFFAFCPETIREKLLKKAISDAKKIISE